MRVLILTPRQPQETGNGVTARRHQLTLSNSGSLVDILEVCLNEAAVIDKFALSFQPDLFHLLHAYRSGRPFLDSSQVNKCPFVVTLTGTDIHEDIYHAEKGKTVRNVLSRAAAIITQNRVTAATFPQDFPNLSDRLHYIHPGIILGKAPYELRKNHHIPEDSTLFLHPASIRPVKQNLELLHLFDALMKTRQDFVVAFCGPVLDPDYGAFFLQEIHKRPWARYIGTLPTANMPATIASADIILNHSLSEGMPNALIESVVIGRPILARNIPGNAAFVDHDQNGLLYQDAPSFLKYANALCSSRELRQRLGQARPTLYDAQEEARQLTVLYQQVLEKSRKPAR
ncbi:glycosyltransferase [Desulfuromonas sp. AOP6]|uniref:glycosyltransferase n=1 Tax=Desulfuromonas sp. AOP6 TaxID=1566351 RepID=UPI00128446F7|nr:glycosyltransferase [Desulfuromonas sp. AOP6]BCA79258.1 hypothetical protein AOP6_1045 [Desulfuromonas sp. AOP6]